MICRRCGSRIPEDLAVRESFKCPECGRQFGTPAVERAPVYEDRGYAYSRDDRRASRSGRYDDRYADDSRSYRGSDRYAEDRRGSRYADDRRSNRFEPEYDDRDGYYDDQYADDGYYDDQQYDDGYYDDSQYADAPEYTDDDLSDLINGGEPRPAGMKLSTVITVVILGIIALIVVFCIDAARDAAPADVSNPPAITETSEGGAGSNTGSQYPVV